MKPIIALVLLSLLTTSTSWADTKQKKKKQATAQLSAEKKTATTAQILQEMTLIEIDASECRTLLDANSISAEYGQGPQTPFDSYECLNSNKKAIREASVSVVSKLGSRGLRDLGKDYIVQAQTTLDTFEDADLYGTELSKLKSLQTRIELELSLMDNK